MVNIHKNKETHSYQSLTNLNISNSIDLDQESCYFGNQDSISAHPFELDQHQIPENHINMLASYPFPKIELENECDHESQLGNSISLLDSMLTPVSLPHFNPFPELTLDHVPIHRELNHQSFMINK